MIKTISYYYILLKRLYYRVQSLIGVENKAQTSQEIAC